MNNRDEQLSAFLDDALDENELNTFLQDLKQSPVEDTEKSLRYKLIRDVLRDDVEVTSFMDISAEVHRAIDEETIYGQVKTRQVSSNSWFDLSSWLRPLSGIAVAASVAISTVVIFRTVETESVETVNQLAAETQAQPQNSQSTDVAAVNANPGQQLRVVSASDRQQNPALNAEQLNEYMMDHSGYAGQSTVQGMMPYVRVVSYGEKANQ